MASINGRALARRFLSDYGMLGVLLLLCGYYSCATMTEQSPRGADAASSVAESLAERVSPGTVAIVATKSSPVDLQFAETLAAEAASPGLTVEHIAGDPAEIRQQLEERVAAGQSVDVVATTSDYATIVGNVVERVAPGAVVESPESYTWPTFLLADNIRNVANQIVVIAIVAVGMTMVIVTAGIDLSVGSLIAFSAVVAAWFIQLWGGTDAGVMQMLGASLLAILACGLVGLFSGAMITAFHIPPFIATLGVMQVASGLAYIIASGESIYEIPDSFVWLGRGADLMSIPNAVVLMALIYLGAHIIMTRTTLGRYIYAVGGNPEAARLSGIRVKYILLFVYTVCGLLAGPRRRDTCLAIEEWCSDLRPALRAVCDRGRRDRRHEPVRRRGPNHGYAHWRAHHWRHPEWNEPDRRRELHPEGGSGLRDSGGRAPRHAEEAHQVTHRHHTDFMCAGRLGGETGLIAPTGHTTRRSTVRRANCAASPSRWLRSRRRG